MSNQRLRPKTKDQSSCWKQTSRRSALNSSSRCWRSSTWCSSFQLIPALFVTGQSHDSECPIFAWSLLSEKQQHDARTVIRAIALSLGNDESFTDPVVH